MASSTIHSQTLRATGTVITLIVGLFIAIALSLGRAQIFTLGPGGHPKSPACGHLRIPHP